MLFNSIDFLIFFPIVVLLYWVIPRKVRYIWLLLASYYFYMNWNAKYALLLGLSTVVTYLCGLGIEAVNNEEKFGDKIRRYQKLIIGAGFAINLGILFFFKYFDFFLANVNRVLGVLGVQMISKPFDVVLPVGISFYTFQALGYIIDVYRGDVKAEKNLLKYALFVSFFPQLVAGPIERSKNLLEQIRESPERKVTPFNEVMNGLVVMVYGLFLKMVIADRISIFVDEVFERTFIYGSVELILALVCFAIQIYCDFGSYSLVAIGSAQIMGFDLMENFNTPFFARSIKELWRRWHISLSTWFKDYLYIPLGGSRCSTVRKYFNLMVTFVVSGLWHGASWNYVVWGGLNGAYQVMGDITLPWRKKMFKLLHIDTECDSYKLWQIFVTFSLFCFSLIFFRASTMSDAFNYMERLFTKWNPWVLFDGSLYEMGLNQLEWKIFIVATVVLFLVDLIHYRKGLRIDEYLAEQNVAFRGIVMLLLIVALFVYGQYGLQFGANQFIYFQF